MHRRTSTAFSTPLVTYHLLFDQQTRRTAGWIVQALQGRWWTPFLITSVVQPTFKGSESPCRFFGLRALHTTKSQGPKRHRPAGAGVEHQRAARPLAHRSTIGPGLLVQTRPIPPPPLGLLSGPCCLGSAGHVYAGTDGPVSGSRCRRASPAPSALLTLRSVRASPATRGRSPQDS